MKTIKQTYFIKSVLSKVWAALVDPKQIDEWGGGPAKMDDKVNTKFSLWGGSIWGTNTNIELQKKLVQDWYSDSNNRKWESPSIVTFELKEEKDGVNLTLLHENIPDADAKDIEEGWKSYYLGPLKDYLEK